MSYVPKKRKIDWHVKIVLPLLVLLGVILFCAYHVISQNQKEKEILQICGWTEEKSNTKLQHSFDDTYTISDYLYYGESLDIFTEDYQLDEKNDLSRKSLQLVNLCNEETITFTMEAYLDRQIDLSQLGEGFYELYVNDNMVKKRLMYDEPIEAFSYTGVSRFGKVSEVKLLGDVDLLSQGESLDKNYVFLQVNKQDASADNIDVYIDPYGYHKDEGSGLLQKGVEGNGLREYQEMYDAALQLADELKAYGLRVEVSKKAADEVRSYYGSDGKMADAYDKNARYYLELGMNSSSDPTHRGLEIYHSNYASETIPSALVYALSKHTNLTPSNAYSWSNRNEGVLTPPLVEGLDQKKRYDSVVSLRESGGIATGAATLDKYAQTNASFAKEDKEGMMALAINFIYLSNEEDANDWKENKASIITQLADAFAASLKLSK